MNTEPKGKQKEHPGKRMSFWREDEYVRTTVKCEVEKEGHLIAKKSEKWSK